MNLSRKKIVIKQDAKAENTFSVLTYNILADCNVVSCRSEAFHFVEDEFLFKEDEADSHRHKLLMRELKHFDSDILFLQEVEDWHSQLLQSELESLGYAYLYFQKVGIPEGCALCYKTDKFECAEEIKFFIHDEVTKLSQNEKLDEVIINQMAEPTIALIATLKHTATGKHCIAANTHIVFDDFAEPAMQCLQACMVCHKIAETRTSLARKLGVEEQSIPVVFGGGFSGQPDHMNIALMCKGKLTDVQMDNLKCLTYKIEDRQAVAMEFEEPAHASKYLSKYLQNPLDLVSAYQEAKEKEPLSMADGKYTGTLDYIFHTQNLQVTSVVDVDSEMENVFKNGGPGEEFASNHLPLIASFEC